MKKSYLFSAFLFLFSVSFASAIQDPAKKQVTPAAKKEVKTEKPAAKKTALTSTSGTETKTKSGARPTLNTPVQPAPLKIAEAAK